MAVAVAEMTLASIDSNKLLHISVSFKLNNKVLLWYSIGLNKRNIQTRSTSEKMAVINRTVKIMIRLLLRLNSLGILQSFNSVSIS
jgi:hypothetical protein